MINIRFRSGLVAGLAVAACLTLVGGMARADMVGLYLFDEGSGTAATDSSDYGNDGTLKGYIWDDGLGHTDWNDSPANAPARVASGVRGDALSFTHANGASPYVNMAVEIPHDASLNLGATFTMAFWANPNSDVNLNGYSRILYKPGSYYLQTDNQPGDNDLYVWNDNGITGVNAGVTGPMTLNAWHHYAIVWDNPTLTLYIDGVQADQVSGNNNPSTSVNPLLIGRDTGTGQDYYGLLDEVAIFDEVLDITEVNTIMGGDFSAFTGGGPPPAEEADLLGLWRFEEGSGATAADSSIHANDGSLGGVVFDAGENGYIADAAAAPDWVAGMHGTAVEFDPTYADPFPRPYMYVPHDDSLNIPESFTLAGWFWFESSGGNVHAPSYSTLMTKIGSTLFQGPVPGDANFYCWENSISPAGLQEALSAAGLPLDQWVHLAIVYDSETTTLKLYRDGSEVASHGVPTGGGGSAYAPSSGDMYVGYYPYDVPTPTYNRDFSGKMDDLALFSGALSEPEVDTIMSGDFSSWLLAQLPTDGTQTLNATQGSDVTLTVAYPGTAGDGDFTWTFAPEGGSPEVIVGETNAELFLEDVQPEDSGTYEASYENGAAKVAATYTITLNVIPGMPVGGVVGFGAIAIGLAAAAARVMRRKK